MANPESDTRARLYDDEGDALVQADTRSSRVILVPAGDPKVACTDRDRIRIQWGHHLLADLLGGRYRTVICGLNDEDNAHGILGELLEIVPTGRWTKSATRTGTGYWV